MEPGERTLVFVESNTTGTGRLLCAAARTRGIRPLMLAADPQRYEFLATDEIDTLCVATHDPAEVLETCQSDLAGDVAGVVSSSEYYVEVAARVAHDLGLPSPDAKAVGLARHKPTQAEALAGSAVPVPATRLVESVDAARNAALEVGLPVVLKPSKGSGSVGVRRCDTAAEVDEHSTALLSTRTNERGLPTPGELLVAEYVDGPEYSVELFDGEVVGVTRKTLGEAPHFVETGHVFPIDSDDVATVAETARAAVHSLGLTWSAVHVELRATGEGPVVIEVNPRLAGGMIPALVQIALGIDLLDCIVTRAIGEIPDLRPTKKKRAAICFVVADRPGTVRAVQGIDRANERPGVQSASVTVQPGDIVRVTHSFKDRIGHVIAVGEGAEEASRHANDAASEIAVQIVAKEAPNE